MDNYKPIKNTFSIGSFIDIVSKEFLEFIHRGYVYDGIIIYGINDTKFLETLRSSLEKRITEGGSDISILAFPRKQKNLKEFDARYSKAGGYIHVDAGWFIDPAFIVSRTTSNYSQNLAV